MKKSYLELSRLYQKYKGKYIDLKKKKMVGGNLAEYIDFNIEIRENELLKESFKDALKFLTSKNAVAGKLLELLNVSGNIHITFYKSTNPKLENCYLVILKGKSDEVLIKLAEDCGFPRGFPIIWKLGVSIDIFGFKPKFDNDSREETLTKQAVFNEIKTIKFNFKYSGFLAQVFAFCIDGKEYWSCAAKNSSGNQFTKDIYRIIGNKMTSQLVTNMVSEKIHFCGECMSFNDQGHGAKVLKEDIVITAVGEGHHIKYDQRDVIPLRGGQDTIVKFHTPEDMRKFALTHNLSVDTVYEITNDYKDCAGTFLQDLSKNRNMMDLSLFHTFWNEQHQKSIKFKPDIKFEFEGSLEVTTQIGTKIDDTYFKVGAGTVQHSEILGNILEGLIIVIEYNDDKSPLTLKYKFPLYTVRTMFLRDFLSQNGTLFLPDMFYSKCNTFISRWVVKESDNNDFGKTFWKYACYQMLHDSDVNHESYNKDPQYVEQQVAFQESQQVATQESQQVDAQEEQKSEDNVHVSSKNVGEHIYIGDKMLELLLQARQNPNKQHYEKLSNQLIQLIQEKWSRISHLYSKINIVLLLGPVGVGKSTLGNLLVKKIGGVHIDGDLLDLKEDEVSKLGEERGDYTRYKIIEAIMNGQVPIVSTGGGVLTSQTGKFEFISDLRFIFGNRATIKFTTFVACDNLQHVYTNYELQLAESSVMSLLESQSSAMSQSQSSATSLEQIISEVSVPSKDIEFLELSNTDIAIQTLITITKEIKDELKTENITSKFQPLFDDKDRLCRIVLQRQGITYKEADYSVIHKFLTTDAKPTKEESTILKKIIPQGEITKIINDMKATIGGYHKTSTSNHKIVCKILVELNEEKLLNNIYLFKPITYESRDTLTLPEIALSISNVSKETCKFKQQRILVKYPDGKDGKDFKFKHITCKYSKFQGINYIDDIKFRKGTKVIAKEYTVQEIHGYTDFFAKCFTYLNMIEQKCSSECEKVVECKANITELFTIYNLSELTFINTKMGNMKEQCEILNKLIAQYLPESAKLSIDAQTAKPSKDDKKGRVKEAEPIISIPNPRVVNICLFDKDVLNFTGMSEKEQITSHISLDNPHKSPHFASENGKIAVCMNTPELISTELTTKQRDTITYLCKYQGQTAKYTDKQLEFVSVFFIGHP
jgi:shikimate kinase